MKNNFSGKSSTYWHQNKKTFLYQKSRFACEWVALTFLLIGQRNLAWPCKRLDIYVLKL